MKASSIVLYTIAGFLFYTVEAMGFTSAQPPGVKWMLMLVFAVPAVLALYCGLAANRFHDWKRDTGIVLLCSSGFMAFLVLTMACMLTDEDSRAMMKPDTLALFSDYFTGGALLVGFAGLGWFLLKTKQGRADQVRGPSEPSPFA